MATKAVTSKAKRGRDGITLGSGKLYAVPYTDTVPNTLEAVKALCIEANRLGYIKGGATLSYTQETYEEKDDLGYVHKIITTEEEAVLKAGLLTWNGTALKTMIDRCQVTEADGVRITKIGGAGNAQGGYYVVIFHHEDKADGDVWIAIVGRNTAGAEFVFSTDAGTQVEPEFKAIPCDDDGTLVQMFEETGTAGGA